MEILTNLVHTLIGVLWIILGFGFLIFVHELGHFLAAKWAGIRTEGFAIGMGPVVFAWRKGIGIVFGSTHQRVMKKTGKAANELKDEELRKYDLGETEYSLRWLPIGGFVKMLGQEDANPNYVSEDPRSFNVCPISKRMVVISAGVIMNIIFAAIFFIWAFLAGVDFPAPVIGDVSRSQPAGTTRADNAEALGVDVNGFLPGDRVISIDGAPVNTFMDIQIAAAMSHPERSVVFTVERAGLVEPLTFTMRPQHDRASGMRSIGVTPARSTTILEKIEDDMLEATLKAMELENSGIQASMRLLSVEGREITTYQQLRQIAKESDGHPLSTIWTASDEADALVGETFSEDIPLMPEYQVQRYPELVDEKFRDFELGLIGISPLTRITQVAKGTPNAGILRAGDVVLRIGDVDGPRQTQLRVELKRHTSSAVEMEVLGDGETITLTASVNGKSQLGISIAYAYGIPLIAETFNRMALPSEQNQSSEIVSTPVADLRLLPRTRIDSVDDMPITDWRSLWVALRERTRNPYEMQQDALLHLTVTHPTLNKEPETLELALSAEDVRALHDLTWISKLPDYLFEPILITRSAEGDPFKALTMGVQETKKLIIMTYLTIDRLFRRTIGVEQLRGPVGIIHIGVRIADRGFIYMLFFLGMISVNLAVINFLPLPIVDGGLFLFLIYEKLKGRPPSIAFQNATTILGLFFIGTIFLVTFYNDVMRLFP